jgi:nicotinamidase-related amidase
MARKPATRVEFTLFDVVYEDGSQRSNRRVPSEFLNGLDGDAPARAIIEEQDRLIAEKSGIPTIAVKSIHRSGSKQADDVTRSSKYVSSVQ